MPGYPVDLRLEGRACVVVGGGAVACRKVEGLLRAGARVRVVAPSPDPQLLDHAAAGRVELVRRPYAPGDLAGAFLAIAATDDAAVNAAVLREARSERVLLNVVDDPAHCDFYVPAVVERGELTIAVSTGGQSPRFASRLREELERRYGPEYGEWVALLGQLRRTAAARISDPTRRRELQQAAGSLEFDQYLREGRLDEARSRLEELLRCHLE